ncbi:hypothetical protein [Chitinophaga polysaccharea]|nr:hypothetical protein [Chitinophaga polysaccharea]
MSQQDNHLDEMATVLKDIQLAYQKHPLSFEVKYTYANEHTPRVVLDSLEGKVCMAGADYRYILDNTEMVRTGNYSVVVFKEDKLLYLGKTTTDTLAASPLQPLQDMARQAGVRHCEVMYKKHRKTLQVDFQDGLPYRHIEMTLDTLSGYLLQMRYIVKTTLLIAPGASEEVGKEYEEYALVVADFHHYQPLAAEKDLFDERSFFVKKGNEVFPAAAYADYKIFIATPNF